MAALAAQREKMTADAACSAVLIWLRVMAFPDFEEERRAGWPNIPDETRGLPKSPLLDSFAMLPVPTFP
jgi:hypothetical protein